MGRFDDAVFERVLLKQAERVMMGSLQRQQPETPFFHYTTRQGLIGILETASIWGTEYRKLNDTAELTEGESAIDAELEAISSEYADTTARGSVCRQVLDARRSYRMTDPRHGVYVTSFSSKGDLLTQWDRYAQGARGFAIGFNSLPLPVSPQAPRGLDTSLAPDFQPCVYSQEAYRAMLRRELFGVADNFETYAAAYRRDLTDVQAEQLGRSAWLTAASRLGASVPYLKHEGFVDEREWRLAHIGTPPRRLVRATSFGDAEYVEFFLSKDGGLMDLHSVVTGPRCPQEDRDFARATLDRLGYTHVPVVPSKVPLR